MSAKLLGNTYKYRNGYTDRYSQYIYSLVLLCLFFGLAYEVKAETDQKESPRFTLYFGTTHEHKSTGNKFHADVAKASLEILQSTYSELRSTFALTPTRKVALRFLSPNDFKTYTGAPAWTSAMYLKGEISIPFSQEKGIEVEELKRALRHEYTHAFIAELSNNRAPAWIDEGIAQLVEGKPNPLLGPALRAWISENDAMPLNWLRGGFTVLKSEIVPAAYAQSLFATKLLVEQSGFDSTRKYLKLLGSGKDESAAFTKAYGITKKRFQKRLTSQMKKWSKSSQKNP